MHSVRFYLLRLLPYFYARLVVLLNHYLALVKPWYSLLVNLLHKLVVLLPRLIRLLFHQVHELSLNFLLNFHEAVFILQS